MKLIKNSILLVLIMVLSVSICACQPQNNEIKTLTANFENSCNKLDLNKMLDCIDPDIAKGVKTVTGIIGMFSDDDTDVLLDKFAKLLFSELPENSREFFSSIKITLKDIEMEESVAYAPAEITYEISGEVSKVAANFEYSCIDDKWYIADLNIE